MYFDDVNCTESSEEREKKQVRKNPREVIVLMHSSVVVSVIAMKPTRNAV